MNIRVKEILMARKRKRTVKRKAKKAPSAKVRAYKAARRQLIRKYFG